MVPLVSGTPYDFDVDPTGLKVVAYGQWSSMDYYDLATNQTTSTIFTEMKRGLSIDADGTVITSSFYTENVKRWDPYDGSETAILSVVGQACNSIYGSTVARSGNIYLLVRCTPSGWDNPIWTVKKWTAATEALTTVAELTPGSYYQYDNPRDYYLTYRISSIAVDDSEEAVYLPSRSSIWRAAPGSGVFTEIITGLNEPSDVAVRTAAGPFLDY